MFSPEPIAQRTSRLLTRVYAWMVLALSVSGITAFAVAHYPAALQVIYRTPFVFLVLVLAQLGLVFYLASRIRTMSYEAAIGSFMLYSFLSGVTLSFIFLAFTMQSIALVFFVCAGMFGAFALYGAVTKADLSSMGSYLMMGLFGLIIAMIVNMFMQSETFEFVISLCGVFIFTLLTAYDMQKLKRMGEQMVGADGDTLGKVSVLGALTLYLDFINLFLFLLRLLGNRRQ